jgi:hypothetical protein
MQWSIDQNFTFEGRVLPRTLSFEAIYNNAYGYRGHNSPSLIREMVIFNVISSIFNKCEIRTFIVAISYLKAAIFLTNAAFLESYICNNSFSVRITITFQSFQKKPTKKIFQKM